MTINNNIISSEQLHPELKIYQRDGDSNNFIMYNRSDVVESVHHWKNILGEKANIQLGDKVGAGIPILDIKYISLLYAISELGGINLILDKVEVGSTQLPRCRVLAPFDLYVQGENADQATINLGDQYSRQKLYSNIWLDYVSNQPHIFSNQIIPGIDDLFMMTPSSGSSGTPKVISYTHQWISLLGNYCAKVLDYQNTNRVLHLTNLHHGGSSGVFFFPTLRYCQDHYFEHGLNASLDKQKEIVKLIVEKQINKVLFPNSLLLDQILKSMPAIDHDCCFYSLQANYKSWIQESRRTGIKLVSIFGASETLGPIFINTIDPQTPDDHDILNYGKPLPGFYSVEIKNHQLQVSDITGNINLLNDKFSIDYDGNYHYKSRSDLIRINEVTLEFSDLHNIVLKHFDDMSAALLPDTVTNKIYLLLSSQLESDSATVEKIAAVAADLKNINPVLRIDYIDFVDINSMLTGIKIDRNFATDHFRKKFNLI